jgi:hypothetical protein
MDEKGFEKRRRALTEPLVNNLNFRNVSPTTMSGRVVDVEAIITWNFM